MIRRSILRSPAMEWLSGTLVVVSLIALVNPFDLLMSFGVEMGIITILALGMATFGVYLWQEQPADEREAHYGTIASRLAYFSGALVLLIGIAIQFTASRIDPWLPGSLAAMVLAKMASGFWLSRR
jgi:uncharacterized membrane-anchored protein